MNLTSIMIHLKSMYKHIELRVYNNKNKRMYFLKSTIQLNKLHY